MNTLKRFICKRNIHLFINVTPKERRALNHITLTQMDAGEIVCSTIGWGKGLIPSTHTHADTWRRSKFSKTEHETRPSIMWSNTVNQCTTLESVWTDAIIRGKQTLGAPQSGYCGSAVGFSTLGAKPWGHGACPLQRSTIGQHCGIKAKNKDTFFGKTLLVTFLSRVLAIPLSYHLVSPPGRVAEQKNVAWVQHPPKDRSSYLVPGVK